MSRANTSGQERLRQKYGPCALVTGASDGIGREFAIALAEAGFDLVLCARREPLLSQLAQTLTQRHGVRCDVVAADLARPEAIEQLLRNTDGHDIGLLVAAAGFGTSGPFLDAALDAELEMIDLNCRAVAKLSHHFGNQFVKRRRGGIVLLSSLVGFQGVPRAANYAATKAYVQSLAEGLRVELRPAGVDVIAVAPGPIASGFAARANMQMSMSLPAAVVARASLEALGRRTTVRPGWLSKALEYSLATLPRRFRVMVMAKVMAGMTGHQRS